MGKVPLNSLASRERHLRLGYSNPRILARAAPRSLGPLCLGGESVLTREHICVRAALPSGRARFGAGAGCSALEYQSLASRQRPLRLGFSNPRILAGCTRLGFGGWGFGFGAWGVGCGVWGLGIGVWGLGFGVWGLGLGVWSLGFGVWDVEFEVGGLGFGALGLVFRV